MNQSKIVDGWVIISIFIIIILIALNIPYTTTESYLDTEYYTEQEPYTTTETYYEKESYIENVPLNINTTLDWHISDNRVINEFDLIATLKNTDNTSGEFWVTFHVESTNGTYNFTTNRVFLKPEENYPIKQRFSGIFSYVTYKVNQPTKEVERYRDVPKERTITGYRDIEKSHEVVRLKEIKLSLLQRLLK